METFAEMCIPIVQLIQSRLVDAPFIEITCLEGHIMLRKPAVRLARTL